MNHGKACYTPTTSRLSNTWFLPQMPLAKALCEALGCRTFAVPGYEADDVMATMTRWGRSVGLGVVLCSMDKDMCQLVRDRVHVMHPRRCIGVVLLSWGINGVKPYLGDGGVVSPIPLTSTMISFEVPLGMVFCRHIEILDLQSFPFTGCTWRRDGEK